MSKLNTLSTSLLKSGAAKRTMSEGGIDACSRTKNSFIESVLGCETDCHVSQSFRVSRSCVHRLLMASSSSIPLTNLHPNSVASYFHFLVDSSSRNVRPVLISRVSGFLFTCGAEPNKTWPFVELNLPWHMETNAVFIALYTTSLRHKSRHIPRIFSISHRTNWSMQRSVSTVLQGEFYRQKD